METKRREFMEDFFDNLAICLVIFDLVGGKVVPHFANARFFDVLYAGTGSRDLERIDDLVLEQDHDAFIGWLKAAPVPAQSLEYIFRVHSLNNTVRNIKMRGSSRPVDGGKRFYASFYDAGEEIRTRRSAQRHEQMLYSLLNNSKTVYFVYHIAEKSYEIILKPDDLKNLSNCMGNYPESVIEKCRLSERDGALYREMVDKINGGAETAECTVQMYFAGHYNWYRVRLDNYYDEYGSPDYAIGYANNVDEYKNAELALEQQQLAFDQLKKKMLVASIFNVTKDIVIDNDMKIRDYHPDDDIFQEAISVEPRIVNQKEGTRNSLLASAECVIEPDKRRRFLADFCHEGLKRLYKTYNWEYNIEYQRRLSNGGIEWMHTRLVLLPEPNSGDIIAFFYTNSIHRRRRMEQIYAVTIGQNTDYTALIDARTKEIEFQSQSEAWKPFSSGVTLYKKFPYEDLHQKFLIKNESDARGENPRFAIDDIINNVRKYGEYTESYTLRAEDGSSYRKQVSFSWLDDTHQVILEVQNDVTEAFRREQQHMAELQEALAAANLASKAKSEFVSRISHDIRTPIGAISNLTAFAKEDIDDREKLMSDLEKIESANHFLLSLINDVLDISKVAGGKIELQRDVYSSVEFIREVSNLFVPMCEDKGLNYKLINKVETSKPIMVDRIRINQIALNIISNAVKYTNKGGTIEFIIDGGDMADGRREIIFGVNDTGIGMSEDFQRQMFDDFAQEYNNPLRPKGITGTGLGLSIVKKLVTLMGGKIEVKSKLGVGTKVRVAIPVEKAPAEMAANISNKIEIREEPAKARVLVAEDNEINREIAARILEACGAEVSMVENGAEALDFVMGGEKIDLVFMDIQMPIMDGLEATRRIRAYEKENGLAHLPIVALTANAFDDAVKKAKEAGVDEYLTKPLEPEKIKAVLVKYGNGN